MKPTDSVEPWKKRIEASRTRRLRYEPLWACYARLHTNAYTAVKQANDDALVTFPNGDQVKAGLVFSNIEQTRALLEVPEIGVRATATDYTRQLGAEDTHRESVVEQALYRSLLFSGLIKSEEEADFVKLDGTILGHGINYTAWRLEEEEVEVDNIPILSEDDAGAFVPLMKDGAQSFEPVMAKQISWEGCEDTTISPLEFLADAACKRLDKAAWHGYERPVKLETLKKNPRYKIPDDIQATSFRIKDIYGEEGREEEDITDAVMLVVIWDKINKELLTFIETAPQGALGASATPTGKTRKSTATKPDMTLVGIAVERWPVTFSHPDASPFSFYIPISARNHPFGISQVEHARNPALEADKLRTRQANITRQIKRIPWYNKNRVDQAQIEKAFQSDDMVPIGLDIRESEKPENIFGELPIPSVHADIYKQYIVAEQSVNSVTGISDVPGGGAETATESEFIYQLGSARANRKKRLYLAFLTSVASRHRDYLREFSPDGETIVVPSVDGTPLTLAYGRQAFEGEFSIEIIAGGGAMSLSPVKQKMMIEATGMLLGRFGPQFDRVYLRQLLTMFDFRDINELMRAAMVGIMPPGGAPGAVPQPGFSPEDYSNPQAIRAGINAPNEGAITR